MEKLTYKSITLTICAFAAAVVIAAVPAVAKEKLIIVNEGNWQHDNGQLSYFEDGKVTNKWFRQKNGFKIGDTPNDIIQINDNLIAVSINWSNIIQYMRPDGTAVAATEDVPNNRKLCTDGKYVYISSYGHECMVNGRMESFTRGYVAKVDLSTFKVIKAVEVGYEPEGIAFYKGHLFVANTGGYAFQEDHEYEHTVDVIDAATMQIVRSVDTGTINLYGKMSQVGQYLCINSPGDYYDVQGATLIFDCQAVLDGKRDEECFVKLECAATYNCATRDGKFLVIGSRYSYYTSEYTFNYLIIDPVEVMKYNGTSGVDETLPGTLLKDLKNLKMPYGIYVNPYTGYIYATDAGDYVAAGTLLQWTPEGKYTGKWKIYINPAHFLALPPDGHFSGIDEVIAGPSSGQYDPDAPIYNLQGMRIHNPAPGQFYIQNGRKYVSTNK